MYEIKNIINLAKGIWVISYLYALPCGCGTERRTVTIRQVTKPAEVTIQKHIKKNNEVKD